MALSFQIDEKTAAGPVLGLVLLQTDETVESEFRQLGEKIPLTLHHARVPCAPEITADSLAAMEAEIPRAASLLPPAGYDAIAYACTSGSTVIGEARVAELINSAVPGVKSTNPLTATKAALAALNIRRLGFLTPYLPEVSLAMRQALEEVGIETVAFASFEESRDHVVARIAPASILAGLEKLAEETDCDGYFVSCTNLRCFGILEEAEARLGRPVVSSNQALAWHMLQLAGNDARLDGPGSLLRR